MEDDVRRPPRKSYTRPSESLRPPKTSYLPPLDFEELIEDELQRPTKTSYLPPSTLRPSKTSILQPADTEELIEDEPLRPSTVPRPTGYVLYKYVPTKERFAFQKDQLSNQEPIAKQEPSSNYVLAKYVPEKEEKKDLNPSHYILATKQTDNVRTNRRPPKYVVYKYVERKPKTSCYFWCR